MTPTPEHNAPDTIWAWKWNCPGVRDNLKASWSNFKPYFDPWVTRGFPSLKFPLGVPEEHLTVATQYTRTDTIPTWQDISTAPRDSVEVLLYTPCGIGIGIWEDREDDCPDQPGHDAGWYGVGYSCDPIMWGRTEAGGFIGPGYIYEPTNQPTHWMPLPAAPTEGADT